MTYDMILKGGRVIDPSQDLDGVADVAFAGGKVAAVRKDIAPGDSVDVRDVSGRSSRRGSSIFTRMSIGAAHRLASTPTRSRARAVSRRLWMPAAPAPEILPVS